MDLGYVGEVWGCRTEAHNTIRVNEQDQFPRTRPAGGATQPDRFCALSEFVNTDRYDHVLGDATTTYNGVDRGQVVNNVKKATREMMYLRPDVFVIYDDVQTTGPVPVDWLAHTLGEITVKGETVTVTQGGAAVDIAVIEPARFDARVQSGPPADTEIRIDDRRTKQHPFVRIRPVEATDHTRMLTVLLPRRAGERQQAVTTPIRAEGVLGVRIAKGDVTGIALFATGEGGIRHSGIATDARSCFLLLQGERLVQVAIHRGARAEYQGQALFPARAERRESIVWQEGQALVEE
ncbi:MAG: heparinase II/III family protein [Armatimonadetes bacterium]|nr:heparinase II/III family protein [Armatimonadota bacterium]